MLYCTFSPGGRDSIYVLRPFLLSLPLGQLPDMTSGERVALIQERIRDVEKRWIELKNEVASLDRKRRRARRKEREGSILSLSFEPPEVNVLQKIPC